MAQSLAFRLKQKLRPAWRSLRARIRLLKCTIYDARRYHRYSGAIQSGRYAAQDYQIVKFYHMVEKGLALPAPRPSFGHYAIEGLCGLLDARLASGDKSIHVTHALEVLAAYDAFNGRVGGQSPACVPATLARAAAMAATPGADAIKHIRRADLRAATDFDADAFFGSRYSVRQFSDVPVAFEKIEAAVRIAQTAPCVCNRQSGRIHIVTDPERRNALLAFQNGNRGFGDTMGALAIVTVDLQAFLDPEERVQGWIDGGLFAMAFVLGLHAQGLGSCCLNWSVSPSVDQAFHASSGISEKESVIMLVAIGELKDEFHVARSPRRPLSDVLSHIG